MPAENSDPHTPEQDADFWFTDGTIVLIAQRTAFRVHQGVLARHSPVFRDLFAVPQPPADEGETLFGCAVVRVQDPAADVRYLLYALYDGRRYYVTSERKYPFVEVAVIIRLAHKYQLEELKEQALAVLKTVFIDNWNVCKALSTPPSAPPRSAVLETTRQDAIAAVHLAHLVGVPRMLPVALYFCCLLDAKVLFEASEEPSTGEGPMSLSREDLKRCMDGKTFLASCASLDLGRILLERSPECKSRARCSDPRKAFSPDV